MKLQEIIEPVSEELQRVKRHLRGQVDALHADPRLSEEQKKHVADVMNHFFSSQGKGLRPALVLLTTKLTGVDFDPSPSSHAVIKFAAAIELFHSASLAHDDIIDKAIYRRGNLSLNEKFGNKIAVVVGDVFILKGFSLLFDLEVRDLTIKKRVFAIMHDALQMMCLGELCAHRLVIENHSAPVEEYIGLLEKKTAVLLSACCECGALLNGQDPEICRRMADFGRHFGIAFQLADDLKDQDALLENGFDLVPLIQEYIRKADEDLSFFPDSSVRKNLSALCDLLLPREDYPGIFGRNP